MVRLRGKVVAAGALVAASGIFPCAACAACGDALPSPPTRPPITHPVTARDLIELREIGTFVRGAFSGPSPLAPSPDGAQVAYVLTRADLASNGYCRALVVSSTTRSGPPRVLDQGGEPILIESANRGFYQATGVPDIVRPEWSPDGRAIAFKRRDAGVTRAWVVRAAGGPARPLSDPGVHVEAIGWSRDGRRLLYAVRGNARSEPAAVAAEGLRGWLYDARINPDVMARPAVAVSTSPDVFSVDLASGRIALAAPEDRSVLAGPEPAALPTHLEATAPDGTKAWADATQPSPFSPKTVAAATKTSPTNCRAAACTGDIVSLWWDGGAIVFLKREGWNREALGLYRWTPGAKAPRVLLRTRDVLLGCVQANAALLCTRETSTEPRRLVSVDMRTGQMRELFDPNPEFAAARLGPVQRLRWRNDIGLETWGDLVLPPDYRPGARLPLVVVQYTSLGFLRGGTGDEYPIFLLAQRGFAVLSIQRPTFVGAADLALRTNDEINAANQRDWAERRSLQSALMTGVAKAVEGGWADPRRVGITGLSDGATSVAFALINAPDAFAAAAVSTCCFDPLMTMAFGGTAWADQLHALGFPLATAPDPGFWAPMSLAQNAAHIDTPLLMQLADSEFRLALESYAALREQHKPVEMYVFPDEWHIKLQPAHRAAIYERTLDWFSFWLQDREDPDPAKADQFARWRAFRAQRARRAGERDP
ncbi:MAG: Atxe2 family lasso peptide isopeptidase [Proteobacteria bacterium]|nr:Atxe2 family lasso peptide isopeptidase [Pseudomonadota bacterium]